MWRVSRDGVTREAGVEAGGRLVGRRGALEDPTTLVVEYTPAGASEPKTLERKLGEAGWISLVR